MSIPPSDNWPPPPAGTPQQPTGGGASSDERPLAAIAYLGGAFISFLVPLVIYFIKKDQSRFVAFHALQAMIFHIVIIIGLLIGFMLTFVLIGFLILPVVGILSLVFSVLAALAASRGEWYELPLVGPWARRQVGV